VCKHDKDTNNFVALFQALIVWDPEAFDNPPPLISNAKADQLIRTHLAFCVDKTAGNEYLFVKSVNVKEIDSILARMELQSGDRVAAMSRAMYAIAGKIQPEIRTCRVASIQAKRLLFTTVEVSAHLLIAVDPTCVVRSGCTAGLFEGACRIYN
jgi:hypothetical protein